MAPAVPGMHPQLSSLSRKSLFSLTNKNPRTESNWPDLGPTYAPEPIPVARGMKEADWPDLSHMPTLQVQLESAKSHGLRARVGGWLSPGKIRAKGREGETVGIHSAQL